MTPERMPFIIDIIAGLVLLVAAVIFCFNIIHMIGPLRGQMRRLALVVFATAMLACLYAALQLFTMRQS